MHKITLQQKRQSMIKNKSEIYPQKSLNLGQKSKSRGKSMNGKIKVVVRKRPISESEKKRKDNDIITVKDNCTIYIDEPRYKVDMTKYVERHEFTVDKVFDETVDNFTVYVNTIKPLIIDIFENNCVCSCFAYGQTGSGKTYTMLGSQPYGQSETPGIFQYAAEDIFNFLTLYHNDNTRGIYISFYEIYCGKLYDLLQKRKMVAALENGKKEVVVKDLKILRVLSKEELISRMIDGVMLRKIGVNSQNDESSRSHAILNIDLKDIQKNISIGKIAFIDLAGSERGADTVAQNKQTQTDGANINRSLLALKECIRAMDSDKNHIPFRDSELTKVLRDIFVGKSKSIMIANVSPTISSCEQTLNTLRYSSRVKNFKHKMNSNEEEDNNNEKISIHDSKSGELNNSSSVEIVTMMSNTIIPSNKTNIKSNELKEKGGTITSNINANGSMNPIRNGKNAMKSKENTKSNQIKYNSVNDIDRITQKKKKKKKNLLNFKSNNTNYDSISKKQNYIQHGYTFSDTSDFSSLDEMNCSLNNNNKNVFLRNRKNLKQGIVKNRSSCDAISSKTKRFDVQISRHSAGSKLTNFSNDREKFKDKSFFKASPPFANLVNSANMANSANMDNSANTANCGRRNDKFSSLHVRQVNERDKNRESDNIFYDAISNTSDNASKFFPQSGQNSKNIFNIKGKNKNNQYLNSTSVGISNTINYDNNELGRSSSTVEIKERGTKGTSLFINSETENTINMEKSNLDTSINITNMNSDSRSIQFDNVSMNVMNLVPSVLSLDNISDVKDDKILDDVHVDMCELKDSNNYEKNSNELSNPHYGFSQNNFNHFNTIRSAEIDPNKIVNIVECKKNENSQTGNMCNKNNTEQNSFLNAEYANMFQKNADNMLDNCLNTLNISNLYEDTQDILNNILLSKYTADKEKVIKKYINEDVNNMSLEKLDKYAQLIYEKRKTTLNKLLLLFKKNVDIQTNNETSDLKKDLVMCHICSNNPDDQFHFYAYSRLEKDMINLIMLRQLWCESENLRQLHQYLMIEYQNKSANLITFNVFPNNIANTSLSKKHIEDQKAQSDAMFSKSDNFPGKMVK
ncbi:kinesin-13 [Plasmodium gonderi]|uniref:Kinesin-13 n=1 Tax=Plasmodium gonderi TaxID=77519 RepID=A0A1Y1JV84_PLAGO|nr:kinesin-13 [Plasmodium gonderi]GAW83814.1 kinesin-13 [Plasmodium gonderi]